MKIQEKECAICKERNKLYKDYNLSWCHDCLVFYGKKRKGTVEKVSKIEIFRSLTNEEMIKIITDNAIKQASSKYEITFSEISMELTKRDLFKVKESSRFRKVDFNWSKIIDIQKEDELFSENKWMYSKERQSFYNYKCKLNV